MIVALSGNVRKEGGVSDAILAECAREAFSINWASEERTLVELISNFRTDAKREKKPNP